MKDSSRLLLGVSGGNTTEAVIASLNGTVLGRGLGPACNHHRVGFEAARDAIALAVERAFAQAYVRSGASLPGDAKNALWARDEGGIQGACLGLSGVDGPEDERLFSEWLKSLGCSYPIRICNNAELILGSTPEGWGVALISGTGSVCVGRSEKGKTARVGGWGYVLGDEGSGYRIAMEALNLATRAADGRRSGSGALLDAARGHFKISDPKELIAIAYRKDTTPEELASFAPRVLDLAVQNEPAARAIASRAAAALADHVDVVIDQLHVEKPPLVLSGRIMRISFKKMILTAVRSPIGTVSMVSDYSQGALATARRLAEGGR
jgi:N-acetylglucosamine kinase-like BadF-type ATPase